MLNYYFQDKGEFGEGEPFNWEEFINDPKVIERDKEQFTPEFMEQWKKDHGGDTPKVEEDKDQ